MTAPLPESVRRLDEGDPLAALRQRFLIAPDVVYLDGNSLGRLPLRTIERLRKMIEDEWGRGLIRSWDGWINLPGTVGDALGATALGAASGQTLVADSTTLNLHKALHAACDLSRRPELLVERSAFPTDRYAVEAVAAQRGRRVRVVDEPATAAFDDDTAVAAFSMVDYRSGSRADVAAITAAAHDEGALALWDLSHAAGAVTVELDEWGVDLAVGCTYKYLNAGPGAPAFLYVASRHLAGAHPAIPGWMGHARPFAMEEDYQPAPTIARFLTGTPDVRGIAAVEEGVRTLAEAGMAAVEAKAASLTEVAVGMFDETLAGRAELITPREAGRRGAHIAIGHPAAWQICQALIADHAVIPDFREPDIVRLGFAPLYTSHEEVWRGVHALAEVLEEGSHQRYPSERSGVT